MNVTTPDFSPVSRTRVSLMKRVRSLLAVGMLLGLISFSSFYTTGTLLRDNAAPAAPVTYEPAVLGATTPDSTFSLDAVGLTKDDVGNYVFPLGSVDVLANFSTGSLNTVESVEAIIHYDPAIVSAEIIDFNQPISNQYFKHDALKCNPVYIQKDDSGQETGTIKFARTAVPLPSECPPNEPNNDPPGSIFPSYIPMPLNANGGIALIRFNAVKETTTPYLISYEYQTAYPNPTDALNDTNAPAYSNPGSNASAAFDTLNEVTNLSFVVGTQPEPVDEVPPSVTLTAPASGSQLTGEVALTAEASDDKGVAQVDFIVDGEVICSTKEVPYTCSLDTTKYSNGSSHSIDAKAYDTATPANTAIDGVTVTVCNGDCAPPTAPTDLKVTENLYNKVTLSWTPGTDDTGIVGYFIYSKKGSETKYTQIGSSSTPTYSDTSVSSSTSYSYMVKAFDGANSFSPPSNIVEVTTPAAPDIVPPSIPANFVGTAVSTSQINLSWSPSTDNTGGTGVAGYNVYRKKVGIGNFEKVNSTVIAGTTYGDSGLTASTQYSYYVTALDKAANESKESATITVQTLDNVISKGNITGTVTDGKTGKPLANVKVTAIIGKEKKSTTTDASGKYSYINLTPGVYTVSFRLIKYNSEILNATVVSGQTQVLNLAMKAK